jgi:myo-inositol-1(or 4)-monophosphatase
MGYMSPTIDFLHEAERHLRICLEGLRPKLLESQGNIEHHLKDDKSVVTEMDTFVEEKLKEAMEKLDPSIGFGGEEGGVDFSQPTFWLADPIDGTDAFIRGLPFATSMIALIDNGQPVFSLIYNFTMGDFYIAIKGHGATVNGHPLHVSDRNIDHAWVMLKMTEDTPGALQVAEDLSHKVNRIRRFAGAGFDYHSIASGSMDGLIQFHGHGHEWDFAPGVLLVQEAGGRVANLGSDMYNYRIFNHIAANPVIFDALMEFMETKTRDAKDTAV